MGHTHVPFNTASNCSLLPYQPCPVKLRKASLSPQLQKLLLTALQLQKHLVFPKYSRWAMNGLLAEWQHGSGHNKAWQVLETLHCQGPFSSTHKCITSSKKKKKKLWREGWYTLVLDLVLDFFLQTPEWIYYNMCGNSCVGLFGSWETGRSKHCLNYNLFLILVILKWKG